MTTMNKWEKGIREKVFAWGGLTNGEWVYLVGLFNMANDESVPALVGQVEAENERLRTALKPFAVMADFVDEWSKGVGPFTGQFDADDLRRAREVLTGGPTSDPTREIVQ